MAVFRFDHTFQVYVYGDTAFDRDAAHRYWRQALDALDPAAAALVPGYSNSWGIEDDLPTGQTGRGTRHGLVYEGYFEAGFWGPEKATSALEALAARFGKSWAVTVHAAKTASSDHRRSPPSPAGENKAVLTPTPDPKPSPDPEAVPGDDQFVVTFYRDESPFDIMNVSRAWDRSLHLMDQMKGDRPFRPVFQRMAVGGPGSGPYTLRLSGPADTDPMTSAAYEAKVLAVATETADRLGAARLVVRFGTGRRRTYSVTQ